MTFQLQVKVLGFDKSIFSILLIPFLIVASVVVSELFFAVVGQSFTTPLIMLCAFTLSAFSLLTLWVLDSNMPLLRLNAVFEAVEGLLKKD